MSSFSTSPSPSSSHLDASPRRFHIVDMMQGHSARHILILGKFERILESFCVRVDPFARVVCNRVLTESARACVPSVWLRRGRKFAEHIHLAVPSDGFILGHRPIRPINDRSDWGGRAVGLAVVKVGLARSLVSLYLREVRKHRFSKHTHLNVES